MIHSYWDILDRAQSGPAISKEDWDFDHIVTATRRLVKRYNLAWDSNQVVPTTPELIDNLFAAGMDLAVESGMYCATTERAIQFSREELELGLRLAPQRLVMGEGKDSRTLEARHVLDERPPLIWAGNPGVPTPESFYQPMAMSWMQEPIVDLATCGSLVRVDGHEVKTGEPSEILAVRRELSLLRDGLRRVGRPGMGLLAAQSAVTELGDLAAAHADYLRPVDSHLIAIFNELIIDQGNLARVVNSLGYGMRNASLACVMVGGLGGDAPGAAVLQAASFILANWVCRADYHLLHPIHLRHVATSTRGVLWVQSAVAQAFARNAPCIIVGDIYPKSGALTKELLYEVAANAIALTVSGAHLEGVGAADGAAPNGSGLEARWMGEVGHAVTRQRLDLPQANALISQLLARYETIFSIPGGNPGVRFDQAYNLETLRPLPAWEAMYEEVKSEVRQLGLDV